MSLLQVRLESPHKTAPARDERSGLRLALPPGEGRSALFSETLRGAAADADASAAPSTDLAGVWQDFVDGRLLFYGEGRTPLRRYLLARADLDSRTHRGGLSRIETSVLVRVLRGEQQKLVAAELGIACSTASKWYTQALTKLGLGGGPIPLPLVIAAQTWASGIVRGVGARSALFESEGGAFFLLSAPNPRIAREARLTHAEQEVAKLLIEGGSRWEIAVHRSTSAQTVACQLRGIFSKLRLTGRHALIAQAVELGWFSEDE